MYKKRFPVLLGAVFFAFIALVSFLGSLQAQVSPIAITSQDQFEIVGADLINPRGLVFGPDHPHYVINSGASATEGEVIRFSLASSTKMISSSKDNTLYESESGLLSNGAGQHFFAGVTSGRTGNLLRRG